MAFLYIGTFGSFIGYCFAFGLVLQNQFGRTLLQAASITFVGPLLGSLIRPVGGKLADRYGGGITSSTSSRWSLSSPRPATRPSGRSTWGASRWPGPCTCRPRRSTSHPRAAYARV
jgi:NNP family nitrate/nitrite transporter-like MFS transporter